MGKLVATKLSRSQIPVC